MIGLVTALFFVDGEAATTAVDRATCPTRCADCQAVAATSELGNGHLEFRATAKPTAVARAGDILVNDTFVRVMQEAAPCSCGIGRRER